MWISELVVVSAHLHSSEENFHCFSWFLKRPFALKRQNQYNRKFKKPIEEVNVCTSIYEAPLNTQTSELSF